jgi:nitrogen regulatory protein P-II 1
MKKIEVVINAFKLDEMIEALAEVGIQGFTASTVRDYGTAKGCSVWHRDILYSVAGSPKIKMEIVVADTESVRVMAVLEAMVANGRLEDEGILLLPCEDIVRIRTGEISVAA